jgi:hypothetical protein
VNNTPAPVETFSPPPQTSTPQDAGLGTTLVPATESGMPSGATSGSTGGQSTSAFGGSDAVQIISGPNGVTIIYNNTQDNVTLRSAVGIDVSINNYFDVMKTVAANVLPDRILSDQAFLGALN